MIGQYTHHFPTCALFSCRHCSEHVTSDIHYTGTVDGHQFEQNPACTCGRDEAVASHVGPIPPNTAVIVVRDEQGVLHHVAFGEGVQTIRATPTEHLYQRWMMPALDALRNSLR
jgi:hypothetical protein